MGASEFPLLLQIKAHDEASGPLRSLASRIEGLKNSKLAKAFKETRSAAKGVKDEALALGGTLLALGTGAALGFGALAKSAMDAGDNLATMSQQTGLSVDTYAQLQFAAAQADVEQEQFNSSMSIFNKNMGMLRANSGPILEFLNKVSPALARQVRGTKTNEEALGLITKAFEKVQDPQRRAALAAQLFGKSNLQMGQFLGTGSAAIDELRKKFFALAGSQEEFAKNSSDLDNSVRETETAFLGLRNAAAGALFPALKMVAEKVTDLLAGNREGLKKWATEAGAAITAWVQGGGMERLARGIVDIGKGLGSLVNLLGGFKNSAIAVGLVMAGPLLSSIVTLAATLPALALAWGPLIIAAAPFIAIAGTIAGAGLAVYNNWAPIKSLFADIWHDLQQLPVWLMGGSGSANFNLSTSGYNAAPAFKGLPASSMRGASPLPPGGRGGGESRVVVDFNNMPKGVQVTPDQGGTQPVDLNLGYTMWAPQ